MALLPSEDMRAPWLLLPLLLGCRASPTPSRPDAAPDDTASGCDAAWYADLDGDGFGDAGRGAASGCEPPQGYVAADGDCDDADPAVFPGAPEVCDWRDQDCDDIADDDAVDAPTWRPDADGDGFGAIAGATVTTCAAPPLHVEDATDCDDADPEVYPGAYERCDGVDQDCDGSVDEDAADADTFYTDLDGDGWGDLAAPVYGCEAPSGAVAASGDCDDADPLAAPDLSERCGGGDEDCDGEVDEADAVDASAWYADADVDGFGDAAAPILACTAPAGTVADATDCDDAAAEVFPGADEVCGGGDEDCDGEVDEDAAVDAATWYRDADRDGYGDRDAPRTSCLLPPGHVADAGDCDDSDATVSPAADEVCGGGDEDCDGEVDEDAAVDAPTWYTDADDDGFGDAAAGRASCGPRAGRVADATDCDDADPAVFPGADEVCGGGDEDCDGAVDEGDAVDALTWYRDADVDGRGDPDTVLRACRWTYGYVEGAGDCDDADPAVHEDLPELCATPYDDDCDGLVNEPGAPDAADYYPDADGDGYGDASAVTFGCATGDGYVADRTDCDDTDPAISPGADEVCGGVDEDCDGRTDESDAVDAILYLDADHDGYGSTVASYRSCRASLWYSRVSGDCLDSDATVYPGATEDCANAVDEDCDGAIDDGVCTDWHADVDADGYGDPAVSACSCGPTDAYPTVDASDCDDADERFHPGAAELWGDPDDLACDGEDVTGFLASNAVGLVGVGVAAYAGRSVAAAGDYDGDGHADLLVGGMPGVGGAYVVVGAPSTGAELASASLSLRGEVTGSDAGYAVDAGDLDGDALPDLLVSAPNRSSTGMVYVLRHPGTGVRELASADATVAGDTGAYIGKWAGFLGDLDGDGLDEVAVAAPTAPATYGSAGAVYVFSALADGASGVDDGVAFTGPAAAAQAGAAADGLGDIDGDGLGDFAVGAPGSLGGAVYVMLGLPAASDLDTASDFHLSAASTDGKLGAAVRGVGDVDGDGLSDLLVGAPSATTDASRAYVVTSRVSGVVDEVAETVFTASPTTFGTALDAGDLDGDGGLDVVIGAPGVASVSAGGAFVFLAPPSGTVDADDAAVALRGSTGTLAGGAVAVVGDVDGDGTDDFLVGEAYDDTAYFDAGVAWFVAGR